MPESFVHVTNVHGDQQRVPANWLDMFPGQFTPLEADQPQQAEYPDGDPTEKWTIAQLTAYAAAHGVDVTGASVKADYLGAINGATTPPVLAAPNPPPATTDPAADADTPQNLDTSTNDPAAAADKE